MANAVRQGSSDAGSSRNRFLSGLAALVLTLSAVATFTAVAYAAPEWDDVRVNSVNRLPARCDAFPLANAADALTDALERAIAELEAPAPKVVYAYAKASLDQTPAERAADRAWNLAYLKAFLLKYEGKGEEARAAFARLASLRPSHVWARRFGDQEN